VTALVSDSLRLGILAAFIVLAATCGLLSTLVLQKVVSQVNSQLSVDRRYDPLWWNPVKYWRVLQDYRRLYPSGVLVRQLHGLSTVMVAMFALATLALGFGAGEALLTGAALATLQWAIHRW
jgi:hypothetical protein